MELDEAMMVLLRAVYRHTPDDMLEPIEKLTLNRKEVIALDTLVAARIPSEVWDTLQNNMRDYDPWKDVREAFDEYNRNCYKRQKAEEVLPQPRVDMRKMEYRWRDAWYRIRFEIVGPLELQIAEYQSDLRRREARRARDRAFEAQLATYEYA